MSSVELLKLVDPTLFYSKFVSKGVFPDGRRIDEFKTFSFKRSVIGGVSVGSSLVRQGEVTVVCSINASLSPLSTEPPITVVFEKNDEIDQKSVTQVWNAVNELIRINAFFSREALLSTDARLEWSLEASFRILHASGELSDACVGALLIALSDVRLPVIELEHPLDDEAPIQPTEIRITKEKISLKLSDFPVSSTFTFHKNEDEVYLLCDPPSDMYPLCHSTCCVVTGSDFILLIRIDGETSEELLQRMEAIAKKRQATVQQAINK